MKTFYIFKINSMFKTTYNNKSDALYLMFYKIYKTFDIELFARIVDLINQKDINNYILSNHIDEFYYYKRNNVHVIDNAFEKSIITINNLYIKLESDKITNSFLDDLTHLNNNFFVIDFENKDYFWTNEAMNVLI